MRDKLKNVSGCRIAEHGRESKSVSVWWWGVGGGWGGGAAFTLKRHCNYEKTLFFYLNNYYICGRIKYPKAIVAKKEKKFY